MVACYALFIYRELLRFAFFYPNFIHFFIASDEFNLSERTNKS